MSEKIYRKDFVEGEWKALSKKERLTVVAREFRDGLRKAALEKQPNDTYLISFLGQEDLEECQSIRPVMTLEDDYTIREMADDPKCRNKETVLAILDYTI